MSIYESLQTLEARQSNGGGNNAANPDWGTVDQVFVRIAENSYTDGSELMGRARPLLWQPAGTTIDPFLGRPVFNNSPNDEIPQGRAGPNEPGTNRIPLTDDLRFVNQPTGDLPQARDISNRLFDQPNDASGQDRLIPNRSGTNDFSLFFGQALTHDMVETQVNVNAVTIPASTGIGWAGGVAVGDDPTPAILVRVDPNTGQPLRDATGGVIPLTEAEIAALPETNPVAWQAIVDHQALSLGSPFALQRTPGVYDASGVRQQANTETSVLDLSNVYGKVVQAAVAESVLDGGFAGRIVARADGMATIELDTTLLLRRTDADGRKTGFLLTSDDVADGVRDSESLLPTYGEVNAHNRLFRDDPATTANEAEAALGAVFDPTLQNFFDQDRFAAGDQRVNQNAATITQQTIWMRNHNAHAERLAAEFPTWTGDEIFNAARALNEANYQRAIYKEYLPGIIGQAGVSLMGAYGGYNPNANPGIINEWTTVAFRFGHDQSSNFVERLREDGGVAERVALIDSFTRAGNATAVADSAELDQWIRGQLSATHQAIDGFVVDGNRNQLFGVTVSPVTGLPVQTDLTVFDIVRGRDHGVNSYVHLRAALGLDTYLFDRNGRERTGEQAFNAYARDNRLSNERRDALIKLYDGDFTKFDAYVGVLLERPWEDSQLGITSTMLIAMQFQLLRDGDRYYYETRFADNPALLAQVEATTMADIVRATTGIDAVYRDAFLAHNRDGGTDGSEAVEGTDGRDLLTAFAGNDTVNGGRGNDDLYGGDGNDVLNGGTNDDSLVGGAGDDSLNGGNGDDTLKGGDGNDTLRGDNGSDSLYGEAGDDTLVARAGDRLFDGGTGIDTLRADIGGTIDLQGGTITGSTLGVEARIVGVENVTLTGDRATSIQGDAAANELVGGGGNDTIFGGDGDDVVNGRGGNDFLTGGRGNNTLHGGDGDDILGNDSFGQRTLFDGGAGLDTLYSKSPGGLTVVDLSRGLVTGGHYDGSTLRSVENVVNKSPNSPVDYIGDAGANRLEGGNRDDTLAGGAGNDTLIGGNGNDVLTSGDGRDSIVVGEGTRDRITDFDVRGRADEIDFDTLLWATERNFRLESVADFFALAVNRTDAFTVAFVADASGIIRSVEIDNTRTGSGVTVQLAGTSMTMAEYEAYLLLG